ncbi:hypothetical protein PSV08DRAFT_248203 [Bipolaris maydis]|uniref:uncharacterized protein n=1 Tax=Cochliobolus heterostrophus TaxID=5016 RepID=UPI0024D1C2DF|nr:hypothetical protein J3E73DRAFT_257831 [Bipolaris maydis]KAJ5056785.1 hypothetical protein J3E74DRAFT_294207 [Bipolaris maydis]KAJ6270456.1 hypothetical protein PSV08DRAFT_248203 [Bipolaris maydis]KAJ6284083.1 hypothetical protein J3E71DRAFT_238753 [Bipolaris maydis]
MPIAALLDTQHEAASPARRWGRTQWTGSALLCAALRCAAARTADIGARSLPWWWCEALQRSRGWFRHTQLPCAPVCVRLPVCVCVCVCACVLCAVRVLCVCCVCVYCLLLINNAGPKQYSPPPVPSPNHGIGAPPASTPLGSPPIAPWQQMRPILASSCPLAGAASCSIGGSPRPVHSSLAARSLPPARNTQPTRAWLSASHHDC